MFITFEGQEGAGKSTQTKLLYSHFLERGCNVILTREPGGTDIAEKIRHILKDPGSAYMSKKAEALLYIAARAQLADEVILPHLAAGGVVLSDRFTDSTIAYQGFGNGLDLGILISMSNFAGNCLVPDITFYLQVDVKEGLERKLAQGTPDRIEQKDLSYHMRVKKGYEYLLRNFPQRIFAINAELPRDEIHKTIISHIENMKIEGGNTHETYYGHHSRRRRLSNY
ncbi:MAG: dTMP kinase [Clostridiales bacterium]|nr:dTMP kinase [Clostridiales bacterium]